MQKPKKDKLSDDADDPQGRLHSAHSRHDALRQNTGRKDHSNQIATKDSSWRKLNDHKVSEYANIKDGQIEQLERKIRLPDTGLLTPEGEELKVS